MSVKLTYTDIYSLKFWQFLFTTVKKKWKNWKPILFSVKRNLCSGLQKAWGLSALFMIISARFEFDLAIYSTFCSFWVSFIYWQWFVVVSRLNDHLTLFLLNFALIELFTFLWKSCFVEFLNQFQFVFYWHRLFHRK